MNHCYLERTNKNIYKYIYKKEWNKKVMKENLSLQRVLKAKKLYKKPLLKEDKKQTNKSKSKKSRKSKDVLKNKLIK